MGLGLGACIVPAAGKRGFELGDTEVEYGLGIHGESGAKRGTIAPADEMLDQIVDKVLARGAIKAAIALRCWSTISAAQRCRS